MTKINIKQIYIDILKIKDKKQRERKIKEMLKVYLN